MSKNSKHNNGDPISGIIESAEKALRNWFDKSDETDDVKNLNYAVTCLKRIVETKKIFYLTSALNKLNEGEENEDSKTDMESFKRSISTIIEQMQKQESDEESS